MNPKVVDPRDAAPDVAASRIQRCEVSLPRNPTVYAWAKCKIARVCLRTVQTTEQPIGNNNIVNESRHHEANPVRAETVTDYGRDFARK